MTFKDIFKSSFLEKAVDFSILDVLAAMLISLALGLFIFVIYKKCYNGVMYSAGFGVSLIAMNLVTTFIILAVTSNVVLSLGMVGALSIVRFRTAVKEPMDIAFIFWAVASGIVTGAGLIPLSVIGAVIIGLILFLFANRKSAETPYLIVVNCENDLPEAEVMRIIGEKSKKHLLKSKAVSRNGLEITVEVRLKDMSSEFVNELLKIDGVKTAAIVSYNGEYAA